MGLHLGGYPAACVGDGKLDVGAGLGRRVPRREGGVDDHVGRLDGQPAALWHRIAGIGRQVEEHLAELGRVGIDSGEAGAEAQLKRDVLADQPAQDGAGVGHDGVEVEDARLQDLAPAEGEQLLGERGGALARLGDLGDVRAVRRSGRELLQEDLAEAIDDGEQVVEVMGDATREPTDRFQFLGLVQPLLQLLARRDIEADAAQATGVGWIWWREVQQVVEPDHAPVGGDHTEFALARVAGGRCRQPARHGLPVLGVDDPAPERGLGEPLRGRVAQQHGGARADEDDLPGGRVGLPHDRVQVLE